MTPKRVLVTGASRGIGQAIARKLAQCGYDPVLHCRSGIDRLTALAAELAPLGCTGTCLQFDCADREATAAAITEDIERHGCYYGVVCNAGIAADAPFPILEGDMWDRVLRTDLDGLYNVLKPIVMPMISARIRGRIVALSSVSGLVGNRGQVNYSAAKAGIIGAVKALAVEVAKRGITVNAVAPGVIDTEMTRDLPLEEVRAAIPMRRLGKAEEVAALVAFLLSEEAAYITRQVISVNGGMF
ncbi:MAG: 3-oxoacyl-ACP reductase FabG [Candidatus Spyradenecus sp.]